MPESFAKTAFAIKPGEVSQPISTLAGIHLIKVTDVKPGSKNLARRQTTTPANDVELFAYRGRQNLLDKATIEYSPGVPHFKKRYYRAGKLGKPHPTCRNDLAPRHAAQTQTDRLHPIAGSRAITSCAIRCLLSFTRQVISPLPA